MVGTVFTAFTYDCRLENQVDEKNADIVTIEGELSEVKEQVYQLESVKSDLFDALENSKDHLVTTTEAMENLDREFKQVELELRQKVRFNLYTLFQN